MHVRCQTAKNTPTNGPNPLNHKNLSHFLPLGRPSNSAAAIDLFNILNNIMLQNENIATQNDTGWGHRSRPTRVPERPNRLA